MVTKKNQEKKVCRMLWTEGLRPEGMGMWIGIMYRVVFVLKNDVDESKAFIVRFQKHKVWPLPARRGLHFSPPQQ